MPFRPYVRMEQLGTTGRIVMKFDIEDFSKICRENSPVPVAARSKA